MEKITDEELASFLEGSLSESRKTEVANAIDNDKQLQSIVEAAIDIDSVMMMEEMRLAMSNKSCSISQSRSVEADVGTSGGTKWGMYLSKIKGDAHTAQTCDEESYRRAAEEGSTKQILLKNKQIKNQEGTDEGHGYWAGIVIGIIMLVLLALLRTCF